MEEVVLVGSATLDEQLADASGPRVQLGGVVTYGGAAFVRGGVPAVAVCNLGGSLAGHAVRVLQDLGVGLCAGTTGVMTSFRNRLLPDGEREQHLVSLGRPIDEELVARALHDVDRPHVHLGPLHGHDVSPAALRVVVARAEIVTLDIQGLMRPARPGEVRLEVTDLLSDALAASCIVKAGRAELGVLLQTLGVTVDELLHEYNIDELVVTCGSDGGYVVHEHGRVDFRAVPAVRMCDTTGAGDVFFATYLVARLYEGRTIVAASERAAAIAARQVAGDFIRAGQLAVTDLA